MSSVLYGCETMGRNDMVLRITLARYIQLVKNKPAREIQMYRGLRVTSVSEYNIHQKITVGRDLHKSEEIQGNDNYTSVRAIGWLRIT